MPRVDRGEKSIERLRFANEGANERKERARRDLIIGQACTLMYFRERIVKGAGKVDRKVDRRDERGETSGKRTRKGVKEEAQE